MPKYPFWGDEFYNGWINVVDQGMLWESLMVYDNFWGFTAASYMGVASVVNYGPLPDMNTVRPTENVLMLPQRGVFTVETLVYGRWHDEKHYSTSQDLPVISLFPILFNIHLLPWVMDVHLLCTWSATANGRLFKSLSTNIPVSHN